MLFKKVYLLFKSSKLAIVLIIYGILISIIGTIIPQNANFSYYINNYPGFISYLILHMNLDEISKSFFTIIPLALFSFNLLVCTGSRLFIRHKKKAKRRYGPDLIHFSLIFLIIGGIVTVSLRYEHNIFLAENETSEIDNSYSLVLSDIEYQVYEDGKVKDLISSVELLKDDKLIEIFEIQVNKPLKYDKYVIYQMSYNLKQTVHLIDKNGVDIYMENGDLIDLDSEFYIYLGNKIFSNNLTAYFSKYGSSRDVVEQVNINDYFGKFKIYEISDIEETALKIVKDPGVKFIIIGLILMISGLFLTIFQKIRDGRIGWQQ